MKAKLISFFLLGCGTLASASAAGDSLFAKQSPILIDQSDGANANYELGMRFKTVDSGQITAIRFYKSKAENGTHVGKIYSSSGALLASVNFSSETASGWQEQALSQPLKINAQTEYTVSVNTGGTYYVATNSGMAKQIASGSLRSVAGHNGVFGPVGSRPTSSWHNSNYFRDVVFVAGAATAPAPTPTPTPAPAASSCALPLYPNSSCTGVPSGTALQTVNGDVVANTAGQVIDGKLINGNVIVRANDVVIRNSQILGYVNNDGEYRFTIEDSTVGEASGCSSWSSGAIGYSNYIARRVRVRGFSDGFRVGGSDILIEDSYVTLCSANPEDHSDGVQAYGAGGSSNIVIRHNVIDQTPVTNGGATAPIFIPNDGANQGNQNISVAVTDNVLAGGGFSLRVFGDLPWTASAVTGNKIVNNTWAYGPLDVTCSHIQTWSGNAVVNYNFTTGAITSQVRPLTDCGPN